MDTMWVRPTKTDSLVHMEGEGRKFLPAEGAEVPRTLYWARRLNDGSVVEAKRPAPAAKPTAPAPAPKAE